MKIKRQIRVKKWFVLGVLLLALLAVASLYFLLHRPASQVSTSSGASKLNAVDLNKPTLNQTDQGNQIKKRSVASTNDMSPISGSDQPATASPIAGSDKKSVGLTITSASVSGDSLSQTLRIRTDIAALVSDGQCTLVLTKSGSDTITRTASVQPQSNTSSCQGFDIPRSSLSAGTWHVRVSYTNGSLTGSAEKDVTV